MPNASLISLLEMADPARFDACAILVLQSFCRRSVGGLGLFHVGSGCRRTPCLGCAIPITARASIGSTGRSPLWASASRSCPGAGVIRGSHGLLSRHREMVLTRDSKWTIQARACDHPDAV
jgi:hypothetical protein